MSPGGCNFRSGARYEGGDNFDLQIVATLLSNDVSKIVTFKATMKDKTFLAALERSAVRETFRADIPMTIRMEIKQRFNGNEWKVTPRGRSVVEVISPAVE